MARFAGLPSILRRPNRKPVGRYRLRREIPWAKDLVDAFFFQSLTSEILRTELTITGSASLNAGGLDVPSISDRVTTASAAPWDQSPAELTVVVRVNNRTPSSSGDPIGLEGGNRFWAIATRSGSSAQAGFFKDNAGNDVGPTNFGDNSWYADRMTTYVFRWDGDTSTATTELWRDDGFYNAQTDTNPGNFQTGSGLNLYIGDQDMLVESVQIFHKALPVELCRRLAVDPYLLWEDDAAIYGKTPAAVGGSTIPPLYHHYRMMKR